MRVPLSIVVTQALVVAVVSGCVGQSPPPPGAQAAEYRAPRTPHGQPDLSGIWQAMNTAHYDLEAHAARPALQVLPAAPRTEPPGLGRATRVELPVAELRAIGAVGGVPPGESVVLGGEIPYQPWALERRNENAAHWLERDPEIKCFLPGVPRATYMPYPLQILQGTNEILIAYEYNNTTRTIHMGEVSDSPAPSWMGWSRGRWDGDTLVVEVTDLNGETWFDRSGNFHSDGMRVTERYTRVSPDHLMYEATIDDPSVFTQSWTIRMPLYRRLEAGKQLLEYKCVEFVEQLMYGTIGIIDPSTGKRNE
jgi:hypothetical protein